jgi:hypothetical protein
MNKKHYTKTGLHPDDAINKVKTFINELQKIQEYYYSNLLDDLNTNEDLNDWIFDYIYNEDADIELMFTEYLENRNIKYKDFVK